MFISIIVGSSRLDSQSAKVGQYITNLVSAKHALYSVKDLFPKLWDNEAFDNLKESALTKNTTVCEELNKTDGFVFVVPEWNGMVPPAMKNLFVICAQEFAHKPALLVTVSAGMGGAYPIAELRMSSYKNSRICYIPDHVIVRHAEQVLNAPQAANTDDQRIRDRLAYSVKVLEEYSKAFQSIRNSGVVDLATYPTGM
ncbi:MAG: NAD(P)H-dependent oxidoreductase [Gammaproteobacteria bacterium]|nr:NAD(P)H-dependent oxidoreductase [Gammaproteobacteria bacterium]